MPLTYEIDHRLKALEPVLDEHAEWFGQVMRRLFYPDATMTPPAIPPGFRNWASAVTADDAIEKISLDRLLHLHAELERASAALIRDAQLKPDAKSFDAFVNLYDDFVLQVRRLERDSVLADSGIDALSGLRSRKAFEKDMERELERRARRGKPFSLVLARIDNYKAVRPTLDEAENRAMLVKIADKIRLSIRSFDDAYRYSEFEFIMILKHADTAGGVAAINRLRNMLRADPVLLKGEGGKPIPLTLSYVSGEPVPGDVIDQMLDNMRADLTRYEEGGSATLEYFEKSPLQRFIGAMEDEKA